MTELIERHLKHVFDQDAARAPLAGSLADTVIRRVRKQRRTRLIWVGGTAMAVAALVATGTALSNATGHDPAPVASGAWATRHGPVPGAAQNDDCPQYSPAAMAARSFFSFDGTVTSIGTVSLYLGYVPVRLVTVTFKVNEWFRGGRSGTVSVLMTEPLNPNAMTPELGPAYGVGARLLVSGGHVDGSLLAWTCGFTLYYDQLTADSWRAAIH